MGLCYFLLLRKLGRLASCSHTSALLHALVSLMVLWFQVQPAGLPRVSSADEETVPITSRPCQESFPRKKESTMTMAEASHVKHMYSRERKRMVQALEGFDPHPVQFRGTAHYYIPGPLKKIHGECICTSPVFDEHYRHWDNTAIIPAHHQLQIPPTLM